MATADLYGKNQYSLTDDQTKLGAPTGFEVTVRNLKISAGAGFIVALTGDIMTMPGLPKVPASRAYRCRRYWKDYRIVLITQDIVLKRQNKSVK